MANMYDKVEFLCKKKGTNITAMCRDLDISRSSLTELKSGRTKSLSTESTSKIANFFGVSVEHLLLDPKYMDTEQVILKKRKALNVSPKDFANKLKVTVNELSLYEQGKKAIPEPIYKNIIDILGLKPSDLSGFEYSIKFEVPMDELKGHVESKQKTNKLRSIARLESSEITPDEDKEVDRYIQYLLDKKKKK
jgi:transcriptional regulator with XRE-family HTH domain